MSTLTFRGANLFLSLTADPLWSSSDSLMKLSVELSTSRKCAGECTLFICDLLSYAQEHEQGPRNPIVQWTSTQSSHLSIYVSSKGLKTSSSRLHQEEGWISIQSIFLFLSSWSQDSTPMNSNSPCNQWESIGMRIKSFENKVGVKVLKNKTLLKCWFWRKKIAGSPSFRCVARIQPQNNGS
jgi:hypothetical protein